MAAVEIYTTNMCPYCHAALDLLAERGVAHTRIDVTGDPAARGALVATAEGRTTVPQIFVDGRPIGGFDELSQLDAAGELELWRDSA